MTKIVIEVLVQILNARRATWRMQCKIQLLKIKMLQNEDTKTDKSI